MTVETSKLMEICVKQQIEIQVLEEEQQHLTTRYDEALKRIQDMQAELEYLRLEVNR